MKESISKLVNRLHLPWVMAWLAMVGIGLSLSIPAQAAPKFTPSKEMMAVQKEVGNKLSNICMPVEGKGFTWCVPIHIHNMTFGATKIITQCGAYDSTDFHTQNFPIAYAKVSTQIPSGQHSYDGTLKLSANFQAGTENKAPRMWQCSIKIMCGSTECPQMKAIQNMKYTGGFH